MSRKKVNKQAESELMKRKMAAARKIERIRDMQELGVLRGEKWQKQCILEGKL